MKKKMSLLGILLLAVVVTTFSVSGTYAKYTSSWDLADEARVAKWEFQLNAEDPSNTTIDLNLFAESYEAKDNANDTDVKSSEAGIRVVAPGTYGEYTFELTGFTETNYTIDITTVINNDIKVDSYDPIFFRVDGGTWVNADDLADELSALYENKVFEAGSHADLDTVHKIEWVWAFDTNSSDFNDDDNHFGVANMPNKTVGFVTDDELDTYLAQQQGEITLDITITATQSELSSTEYRI